MSETTTKSETTTGPYVLVRTYSAGVHVGTLAAGNGREVNLTDSRRIWYWDGAASLSELAVAGTAKPDRCKFSVPVTSIVLTEAIEIIEVTDEARANIAAVPVWSAR